jgi:NADPH:quinone reductase-like Zn-dependent oxidoreductase
MQVLTSNSPAEPLHWVDIPAPKLRANDVRVQVRAVGVNPVDWKMREGDFLGTMQKIVGPRGSLVPGVDFAGEVTEVGSAVTDLKVGDRVVGGTDFSRGQYGSYAKTVQVGADQVAVLPPSVSFEDAACLPVAGVTAWTSLFKLGHLGKKPNSSVLVLGASGGVGHFAIQLAKIHGAKSVGVCSSRNVELVERLGAIAIDYSKGDVATEAAKHGPFDIVVDAIGSSTYPVSMCRKLLKPGGKHIVVAPKGSDFFWVALPGPTRTVLARASRNTLEPLVADLASGKLQVVITERVPLDDAERAHKISRTGKVVGKVVMVASA